MFFPVISAWMKKLYDSARFRIDRGKIRPFMPIAVKASQGKVFRGGGPAMLDGNDVIRFVTRNISFGHETVFAPTFGASVDESEQGLRDIADDDNHPSILYRATQLSLPGPNSIWLH